LSTGACHKGLAHLSHLLQLNSRTDHIFQNMSQEAEIVTPGFSISNLLGLEKLNMAKAGEMADKKMMSEKTDEILHSEFTEDKTPQKLTKVERHRTKKSRKCSENEKRRYRATFDKAQIYQMERMFMLNHYPDVAGRSELSKSTGLSESQVQIWFQNRRAKWRKQQRKRRHGDLPPIFGLGYPTHLARYYSGYNPYALYPLEYYNTDFWSCAQQQIAAWQYSPFSQSATSPTTVETSPTRERLSPRSDSTEATGEQDEKPLVEGMQVRNTSSIATLRIKAQEHV